MKNRRRSSTGHLSIALAQWSLVGLVLFYSGNSFAVWLRLVGLGPNRAELQVNNAVVRVLHAGDTSPEGIKLLSLSGDFANIEVNGMPYRLSLGQRVEPMAILSADRNGHYLTDIAVNGRQGRALVDTGATAIAFSRSEADRLGLSYQSGKKISMRTASGSTDGYLIVLDSVQLGSIELRNVEAVVSTLQNSPAETLLGMSFLRRLDMKTDGTSLKLMYLK